MRITQGIISNSMLHSINNNSNKLNKIYQQIYSGKQIQMASEDPILASRALRYTTNIAQTEQYKKNANYGLGWMNTTDKAFSNLDELMVQRIGGTLLVQGSSDTLSLSERKKIVTEMGSLFDQMKNEMNVTYSGRYVFSGFKTDEPPFLVEDDPNIYRINQEFTYEDMEEGIGFQKDGVGGPSTYTDINVLRLPYDDLASPSITIKDSTGASVNVAYISNKNSDPNAYKPDANRVNFIEETGELVLGDDVVGKLKNGELTVTYEKEGLKEGELNPVVYFDCSVIDSVGGPISKDVNGNDLTYTMDNNEIKYEVGVSVNLRVNSMAKDVLTPSMYAKMKSFKDTFDDLYVSEEEAVIAYWKDKGFSGDDLDSKVKAQLEEERGNVKHVGYQMFNRLETLTDGYASTISVEHTSLGTRTNRMDLIYNRLEEDYISYTELYTNAIGTDYAHAGMKFSSANTIYQASLQIGAQVMNISLVNYM
ncbi:MAG: flagellar hook-associated protein FlgL [Lachnospirales bacterium]